jgi:hypothetical protein
LAEVYHSTPETQTDESYNHPEDIEHFAHHDAIERTEAEREAKFQGITVEEALRQNEEPPPPNKVPESSAVPKVTRVPPPEKQEPQIKYGDAAGDAKARSEWGSGEEGFKSPKTPAERLRYDFFCSFKTIADGYNSNRKNVPYKVIIQFALSSLDPEQLTIRTLAFSINSSVIGATFSLFSCVFIYIPRDHGSACTMRYFVGFPT